MAQAAFSFNGSKYLPLPLPSPNRFTPTQLWFMAFLSFSSNDFYGKLEIQFQAVPCFLFWEEVHYVVQEMTSIKFYYTNQIVHPELINIFCVLTLDPIVYPSINLPPPPPVDQRTNCVARGSVVPGPLLY